MTNPITTPAEALEAAALITDEEATYWARNCNDAERVIWEGKSAAIRALSASIAAPVAVVRPLIWPDFREGGTCGRPHQVQYFVTQDHDWNFWSLFDQHKFGSLAEAQANCESHWQRTMVTIQPAAQVQAEAVAGAYISASDALRYRAEHWSCGCDPRYCRCYLDREQWELAADEVGELTPADAQAALARRDAEVREKALREAAAAWLAYERATTTEEHHNAVSRIRNAFGIEVTKND